MTSEPLDRVMATLVRRLLDDGLKVSEVCQALDLAPEEVRELRHWHPASKFDRDEAARYRDLIKRAAWRLPYWGTDPDGRLVLLPVEVREARRMERAAQYQARVRHGTVPAEVYDLTTRK